MNHIPDRASLRCDLGQAPRLQRGWRRWAGRIERRWLVLALLALALFGLRAPFLPPTLDDIDGINFELGIHDYDPVAHQPHPPGYPVFIFLAKLVHPLFTSHARGLAFVSVVFGSLLVFPLYLLMRELTSRPHAALACALTLMNPLVWFNSVRPMSDQTGLFAAVASQCLLLKGIAGMDRNASEGRTLWYLAVVAAGLAIGVRLQVVVVVGPVLLYGWIRHREIRVRTVCVLTVSMAAWLIPVAVLSGGPAEYIRSFSLLISDALPVEPLLSAPTIHRAAVALLDVLVAPWGSPWLATPILLSSALGAALWVRSNPRGLGWMVLLFVPYGLYHYFLQMTATIRYGIPLVPLVAALATVPLVYWRTPSRRLTVTLCLAFAAISSVWTGPALVAYHTTSSPSAQALSHLRHYASGSNDFVVSGHHVFARYLTRLKADFTVLPSDPGQTWRALGEYWKDDGRKPILFLNDPARTTLLQVGRDTQHQLGRWSWPESLQPFMKGERPSRIELLRLDPPRWFSESGFFITREAGLPEHVATENHRAYVRPSSRRRAFIASGVLSDDREVPVTLQVGDDTAHERWLVRGNFTLRTMLDGLPDGGRYVPLSLVSPAPVFFTDLWIGPEDQPVIRPGKGFYSPERDRRTRLFRWMAPRADAIAYLPTTRTERLIVRGHMPLKYYRLPVTLSLEWNGRPLTSFSVTTSDFRFEYPLTRPHVGDVWGTLTLISSHDFVPHERQMNGDLRILAARIYELSFAAVNSASDQSEPSLRRLSGVR